MEERAHKSCWGVTVWTVVALGGVLALVILFGGFDTAHQAIAAAG